MYFKIKYFYNYKLVLNLGKCDREDEVFYLALVCNTNYQSLLTVKSEGKNILNYFHPKRL